MRDPPLDFAVRSLKSPPALAGCYQGPLCMQQSVDSLLPASLSCRQEWRQMMHLVVKCTQSSPPLPLQDHYLWRTCLFLPYPCARLFFGHWFSPISQHSELNFPAFFPYLQNNDLFPDFLWFFNYFLYYYFLNYLAAITRVKEIICLQSVMKKLLEAALPIILVKQTK